MTRLLPTALLLATVAAATPAFARGEIVDRIVATVGKRVITLSEVQEVHRFESLINGKPLEPLTPERLREVALRLVDQALLQQEMLSSAAFRHGDPRSAAERQLAEVRKQFGNNGDFRRVLEQYGLDEQRVLSRLETQFSLDLFLEARFRPGVQVDEEAIERYYRQTLLPELQARGVRDIPDLDQVREQIEEVLVQERINTESASWLKDLRAQARVQVR